MDKPVVENPELLAAALSGLTRMPKTLDPKWFYDDEGSRLFEQITDLPEYYPTRTERAIIEDHIAEIASCVPDGGALVELRSGSSSKTRLLLDAAPGLSEYVPVDISAAFLRECAGQIGHSYNKLEIRPVVADFTRDFQLPADLQEKRKTVFFPGSTLGNLEYAEAVALLARVRSWQNVDAFILGVDLIKPVDILLAAYDDAQGVTSRFNRNILVRMNREIGANFDVGSFSHEARWNADMSRIELHLVSTINQIVAIGSAEIGFRAGESIHTESSHKYNHNALEEMANSAGWNMKSFLTDQDRHFAVLLLQPADPN